MTPSPSARAQIESLRSMEEMFGRSGGSFLRLVGADLGRLADRIEYDGQDLETILWNRMHGEQL